MKKQLRRRTLYWALGFLIIYGLAILGMTIIAEADETCQDGNGWTKIDSGDLSLYPVEGATELCFKAGQWVVGAIPEGGFGQEGSCNDGPQFCELSHWSYFIPVVPTSTDEPTSTPTPTEEPTATETATPSPTLPFLIEGTLTPTPTFALPTETATPVEVPETATPTSTPTEDPAATLVVPCGGERICHTGSG